MNNYTSEQLVKLTHSQLSELCKQNGKKGYSKLNKNGKINLLLKDIDKEDLPKQVSNETIYNTQSITIVINNKPILINFDDICDFDKPSVKSENDKVNKIREAIMNGIINNKMPNDWYNDSRWSNLKTEIMKCLQELHNDSILTVVCDNKGGRKYNYDLDLIINNLFNYKVEFKFDKIVQDVSPTKPSKYVKCVKPFEEEYYDNYLSLVAKDYDLELPNKLTYLKDVHSNTAKCMESFKDKYDTDLSFKCRVKEASNKCIENFIKNNDLDSEKLTKYLLETQKEKKIMIYNLKTHSIELVTRELDDFVIMSYEKTKNSYLASTKSGNKMDILLRWKNRNGIAFPAFQIKIIKNK